MAETLSTEDLVASGKHVLDAQAIDRSLTRLSYEIIERTGGGDDVVVLGIPTRGEPVAARIVTKLAKQGVTVAAGVLDITMYRDDLDSQPTRAPHRSDIPACGIDDKTVILVDDVLYSGRTIRAALEALADIGRPAAVQLAVLVDRGHRQLPIRPDYVGKNLPTSRSESVHVLVKEIDGVDAVVIGKGA
ncbi:MAG: bifunctional pyr operon transcriptional regulator/uracil phosphoribosyltransferase PyrR [Actinomycetaceae bacterium]|nr:bifunctional pyr operon transcriptional regulator/uracil phosphoribosyltransferase PyrR [Actinomycetaceae bacterium]